MARADLLVQCCVANDLPFLRKREKVKPFQRETVEGQVLLADVTGGGIRSKAVERRSHTAHWSVSSVCLMKMQRLDHPEWNHHACIHRNELPFWALRYSSE